MRTVTHIALSASLAGLYLLILFILIKPSVILGSSEQENAATSIQKDDSAPHVKKQRVKSPLEMKFSIEGPDMSWVGETRTINLDYSSRNWVQSDRLTFNIWDYDCSEELPADENNSNLPSQLSSGEISLHKILDEKEGNSDKTWRLALEVSDTLASTWYRSGGTKFCVRMMLWTLPVSNEHSMEVNFVRTQLDIKLDKQAIITSVELTKPENVKVQVVLPGGSTKQSSTDELTKDSAKEDAENKKKADAPTQKEKDEL